jgi:hypothetical protein
MSPDVRRGFASPSETRTSCGFGPGSALGLKFKGTQRDRSYSLSRDHQPRFYNVCCSIRQRQMPDIYTVCERTFR